MIQHYLKVALRNLLKYKLQTCISILSISIGFACMALSLFWNHYEMTYDAFHKNADRIYRVRRTDTMNDRGVSQITPGPLAAYLKKTYPEVETACAIRGGESTWEVKGNAVMLHTLSATPEVLDIFDFQWCEGDRNMAAWKSKVAITDEAARRLFGDVSPLGMKIKKDWKQEYEIAAVVKVWPKHSNFRFDLLELLDVDPHWNHSAYTTYALLDSQANSEEFLRKVRNDTIGQEKGSELFGSYKVVYDIWTPLKAMHYTHASAWLNVSMEHVRLFTAASVLIVLVALLNYLTLFVSRLRAKGRTMGLRTVCGSSGWQLSLLLMTEYILLLLGALLFSMVLMELCMPQFMQLADVSMARSAIYRVCALFIASAIAFAACMSFVPIRYFKRETLHSQISSSERRMGKQMFRRISICLQLAISIFFMYCSFVMFGQVRYLSTSDLGVRRNQIAWIMGDASIEGLLRQVPAVQQTLQLNDPLFPPGGGASFRHEDEWEGKASSDDGVTYQLLRINDSIAAFYGIRMKEGVASFDLGKDEIIINETLAKMLRMEQPIGKTLGTSRIKGVVHDLHIQPPTSPSKPFAFIPETDKRWTIAFAYSGDWQTCSQEINRIVKEKTGREPYMKDAEETYEQYIVSERNLLKLLGVITVVSILISLFGIYALMIQTSEQRRKEIAIRKVNGAKVGNILFLLFKEYLVQAVIAAVIAFPLSYFLMKRWLENYERQMPVDAWIFLSIFAAILLLIAASIGWRVWRTANENPAEVIKSE